MSDPPANLPGMTTLSQLRKAALALPEVTEAARSGTVSFSVRGAEFASVTPDGQVWLCLPDDATEAALAAHPTGQRLTRAGGPAGFQAPLADINGKDLNALVAAAWSSQVPRRMAEARAAADTGVPPPGSDLPPAIGKPATRALLRAGLTTLAQVASHTEQELLALHGVGPRAVRILTEVLAQEGMSLRR